METRKTARLILRPWALIDAEVVYEQARNPKIEEMCGWPPCACWRNADFILITLKNTSFPSRRARRIGR